MRTYAWRRLDVPGLELATWRRRADGSELCGQVLLLDDGVPLAVDYRIETGDAWGTRLVEVEARRGRAPGRLRLEHHGSGRWSRDGRPDAGLDGCLDVDLGVTPLTNALPVNRLRLAEGAAAEILAAWVRFPGLSVDPTPQRYQRLAPGAYRYTGLSTGFTARVEVDTDGFPLSYERIWQRV